MRRMFWKRAFTLKARLLGDVEGGVGLCECIFCKAASRRVHLMERSHSVSGLELSDGGTHSVGYTCYIVTMIKRVVGPFCILWGKIVRV